MHVTSKNHPLIGACAWLTIAGAVHCAEPIKPEQFDKIRAVIRPQRHEDRWAGIGWRTDLWGARQEAAAAGKPILLWEMDGHPLGCG
jgi:hypothetical protein